MREFEINTNEAGQRFDKYLKKLLGQAPGSFVYKMLRKKNIVLNGKKADGTEKLREKDRVTLFLSDETFEKFSTGSQPSPEYESLKRLAGRFTSGELELQVVYEDADVIIINKPSGMLSQKAKPSDVSANEYILAWLMAAGKLTPEEFPTFKPSVCNRLDRNTSGLLAAGKTLKGLQELSKALKERSVQKYYRCIVKGEVLESARIDGWLVKDRRTNQVAVLRETNGEDEARRIETEYRPVQVLNGYTELEVHLITGRSHQIRAQLAVLGHPIVGDVKYGDADDNALFRKKAGVTSQLLHAYRMVFSDGTEVTAPCGEDFGRAKAFLSKAALDKGR